MNDARERMLDSPIYSDAVKHLIGKLLVPENLTSTKHKECLAEMRTKFFDEHQKFVNQTGILNSDTMWLQQGRVNMLLPVVGPYLDTTKNHGTWKTGLLGSIQSFRNRISQTQLETGEKD
jgi:hypothetical protein